MPARVRTRDTAPTLAVSLPPISTLSEGTTVAFTPGSLYAHSYNYVRDAALCDTRALHQVTYIGPDGPGFSKVKGLVPGEPDRTSIVPTRQIIGLWFDVVTEFESRRNPGTVVTRLGD